MDISINTARNGFSTGIAAVEEGRGSGVAGVGSQVAGEDGRGLRLSTAGGVSPAPIGEADAITAVPDSALSRSDDLGRMVAAAFNLPPPPMPDFASA